LITIDSVIKVLKNTNATNALNNWQTWTPESLPQRRMVQDEFRERPRARIRSPKLTDQRMRSTESRMIRYMGDNRVQKRRREVRRMWRRVAEACHIKVSKCGGNYGSLEFGRYVGSA
jgi:hypothetical protein